MNNKLSQSIKNKDYDSYRKERYASTPDGEDVSFKNEDFSGVDFDPIVTGFFVFDNCTLDGANMHGQPVTINNCSAKNLDVRGRSMVINAINSDFTGMLFDDQTNMANSNPSTFTNCTLDKNTADFLLSQHAKVN